MSTAVILILGFANLLADGFSMGASNVLARRSQARNDALPTLTSAAGHGLATFLGFVTAGLVPLRPISSHGLKGPGSLPLPLLPC